MGEVVPGWQSLRLTGKSPTVGKREVHTSLSACMLSCRGRKIQRKNESPLKILSHALPVPSEGKCKGVSLAQHLELCKRTRVWPRPHSENFTGVTYGCKVIGSLWHSAKLSESCIRVSAGNRESKLWCGGLSQRPSGSPWECPEILGTSPAHGNQVFEEFPPGHRHRGPFK